MSTAEYQPRPRSPDSDGTAFLIIDTESVPDGSLISAVKYPGENLGREQAVERCRREQSERSFRGSDFIPVTFQIPVAVAVVRVSVNYELQAMTCLDAPHFRTAEITRKFWLGIDHYCNPEQRQRANPRCTLVTFNGRGFDLPLMELAAFRQGLTAAHHYQFRRRMDGPLDLMEFFTNFGASKLVGGLDLLAKMLGLPGKMETRGQHVYDLYREGKLQEINDYCLCDTLDTYFVFLRTRVLIGEITLEQETDIRTEAQKLLASKCEEYPILNRYLENFKPGSLS